MRFSLPILVIFCMSALYCEENLESSKVSEAFGHLISQNMESLGVKMDIQAVVKGLQDAANGKDSPMSNDECIQALTLAQEKVHKDKAEANLKSAETFLTSNARNEDVISLDKGKLQYKIEKSGSGKEVEPNFSPIIRYVGKFLDGSIFGQSKQDEVISLEETIPGFSKGLVGMREGEKRTLFIHPEYGYGTQGFLPPNSLLTFEVECIKANDPEETKEKPEL